MQDIEKDLLEQCSKVIPKTVAIVIGYFFITIILGAFINFGYIWWAITFTYIIAIAGGIAYIAIKYEEAERIADLIKKGKL